MSVFFRHVFEYRPDWLFNAVIDAVEALKFEVPRGGRILLKPNLVIAARPEEGITTHPVFTEAVIRAFRAKGAEHFTILEGPGIGEDPARVFRVTGYEDLARRNGARLLCADKLDREAMLWRFGEIEIPKAVFEHDVYVNLVKMKTHVQTMVTLCMKNQKGLLAPQDKKKFHYEWGLWEPVVELGRLLQPHLNLVDGIVAMEGDGPTHRGRLRTAGAFLAGTDMVETEMACLDVMGIEPDRVPYLRLVDRKPRPDYVGTTPINLKFLQPDLKIGKKKKVVSHRNPWACSLCTAALSLAIKKAMRNPKYWFNFLPKFMVHAYVKGFHIVQGKKLEGLRHDELVFPVCFGQCTRELAEEHGYPFVKGCPPKPDEVLRVLSESMKWR